jgi:hypothetical protein
MNAVNCPFCGVVTDVPHNSQAGCIEALTHEISRIRRLLELVRPPGPGEPPVEPVPEPDRDSAGHD